MVKSLSKCRCLLLSVIKVLKLLKGLNIADIHVVSCYSLSEGEDLLKVS